MTDLDHTLTCARCDDGTPTPEHLACNSCAEDTARQARAEHRRTGRHPDLVAAQVATMRSLRRSAASARATAATPMLGDPQQHAVTRRIIDRAIARAAHLDAAANLIEVGLPAEIRRADADAARRLARETPLTTAQAAGVVARRGPAIVDHLTEETP